MKGSPRRREPELQAYKSGTQANPKPIASLLRTAPPAFATASLHDSESLRERANATGLAWQAGVSHDRFQAWALQ